ncbi:MAG: hypothetical protein AAGJ35_02585 [Myxococcota bacterium]
MTRTPNQPKARSTLQVNALQATIEAQICYGRVVLHQALLVYEIPGTQPIGNALSEERIQSLLQQGQFLSLSALRFPLDVAQCQTVSPATHPTCALYANPNANQAQSINLSLILIPPDQATLPRSEQWDAPCEMAKNAALGKGPPPVLMLFVGFLEDPTTSFAQIIPNSTFQLRCSP